MSQAKPYAFSAAMSVVATVVAVCQKADLDISVCEKRIELCLLHLWQEESEPEACCILERKKSAMSLFKSKCMCTHFRHISFHPGEVRLSCHTVISENTMRGQYIEVTWVVGIAS